MPITAEKPRQAKYDNRGTTKDDHSPEGTALCGKKASASAKNGIRVLLSVIDGKIDWEGMTSESRKQFEKLLANPEFLKHVGLAAAPTPTVPAAFTFDDFVAKFGELNKISLGDLIGLFRELDLLSHPKVLEF